VKVKDAGFYTDILQKKWLRIEKFGAGIDGWMGGVES
jgi:hypothetical protein